MNQETQQAHENHFQAVIRNWRTADLQELTEACHYAYGAKYLLTQRLEVIRIAKILGLQCDDLADQMIAKTVPKTPATPNNQLACPCSRDMIVHYSHFLDYMRLNDTTNPAKWICLNCRQPYTDEELDAKWAQTQQTDQEPPLPRGTILELSGTF